MQINAKLIFISLIFFLFISTPFLSYSKDKTTNDRIQSGDCCQINHNYEITDDCCVKVIITSRCSNLRVLIKQWDRSGYDSTEVTQFVSEQLQYDQTIEQILCPLEGETSVSWSVYLFSNNDPLNPECNETIVRYIGWADLEECVPCKHPEWLEWEFSEIGCPDGYCRVNYKLNIPDPNPYTCYIYEIDSLRENVQDISFPISNYDFCLAPGEIKTIKVYLKENPNDPLREGCLLEQTISCPGGSAGESNICIPAYDGCNKPYIIYENDFDILCNGQICHVIVKYAARKCSVVGSAEGTLNWIQILKMELPSDCNCNEAEIYQKTVAAIYKSDHHGFEIPTGCWDVGRVLSTGCWATFYYNDFAIWPQTERKFVVQCAPGIGCCESVVRICKTQEGDITINSVGSPIFPIDACNGIGYNFLDLASFPCQPKCEWLNFVNITQKQNLLENKNEEKKTKISSNGVNAIVHENNLSLSIYSENGKEASIEIFDLLGNLMLNDKINIHDNITRHIINLSALISGDYLYSIKIDGLHIYSNKFTIIK